MVQKFFSDLVTLSLRAGVFLLLLAMAYYFGYGTPLEEWRKDSPGMGVAAKYTRNGRPWRIFYDRDRNRKWDMWIDERAGPPYIVSMDDDGDGQVDREEDELGNPLSTWQASKLRARKTLIEFVHNGNQLAYTGLAVAVYALLELAIRSRLAARR